MTYADTVVNRCTRNGVTAWQHVATQLGMSQETAKALYGPIPPPSEDDETKPERPAVRRR